LKILQLTVRKSCKIQQQFR